MKQTFADFCLAGLQRDPRAVCVATRLERFTSPCTHKKHGPQAGRLHECVCTHLQTAINMLLILLLQSAAFAVTTSHWTQHTEKDWNAGKFKDVVATNLGDVKLSRQVQSLLQED